MAEYRTVEALSEVHLCPIQGRLRLRPTPAKASAKKIRLAESVRMETLRPPCDIHCVGEAELPVLMPTQTPNWVHYYRFVEDGSESLDTDGEIMGKTWNDEELMGKWLLYFPNEELDEAWARAKLLFRELPHAITRMKTQRGRESSSDPSEGVIVIYDGGPVAKVKERGRIVVDVLQYHCPKPQHCRVYFKDNSLTRNGTYARNSKCAHTLWIPNHSGSKQHSGQQEWL